MATLKIKFLATSIQMQMHFLVFVPDAALTDPASAADGGLKVLWLLHGEGGDCSDWTRLSMVEHYAQAANIAVVMPNVDNSMYMDMAHGGYPYFTYLMNDVPRHARHLVQILSDRQEDNFVAGVGVGGYGAVKWMLRSPQMFASCASLSGDVDMVAALRAKEAQGALADDRAAAFGEARRVADSGDDILALMRERVATHAPPVSVYMASNALDDGFERDRQTARALRDMGAIVVVNEAPGEPGWPSWNFAIRDFIDTVVQPMRREPG